MSSLFSTGLFLFVSGFTFGWIGHMAARCLQGWASHRIAVTPASGNKSTTSADDSRNGRNLRQRSYRGRLNVANSSSLYTGHPHQTLNQISRPVIVVGPVAISALV